MYFWAMERSAGAVEFNFLMVPYKRKEINAFVTLLLCDYADLRGVFQIENINCGIFGVGLIRIRLN